jgi:hypothetical protein
MSAVAQNDIDLSDGASGMYVLAVGCLLIVVF